jgi:RNA polymerase sigma-70 factor (ECF subfamily)
MKTTQRGRNSRCHLLIACGCEVCCARIPELQSEAILGIWMDDPFDDLLARSRGGDRDALEELFAKLELRVLAIVRKRMGDELRRDHESADIKQSVMKDAFCGLPHLRGQDGGALLAWIATLVEHNLASKARHARRFKRDGGKLVRLDATSTDGSPAPLPMGNDPSVSFAERAREERIRLYAALETLPEHWRDVVVLRAIHGMNWPSIAERTGQTVKAAQGCYTRASIRLAQIVRE